MVDGAVSAVVAGPVSTMPEEWVCPLLGVDPDDFNHDTETFSAIAATLMHHNAISETLSTKPVRHPGDYANPIPTTPATAPRRDILGKKTMPIPMDLQHATECFERFLIDARDNAHLTTRNQTYTMVQGVLLAFRRRLDHRQAIGFANVLPPVLRAIFVADWNLDEPKQEFEDRATMTREVQALRKNHNFAPDSCIADVAKALRNHVDLAQFERVLEQLPEGAREFWSGR